MPGETYLAAGVDQGAAREATERIKPLASRTLGPNVIGGVGFFGGMYRLQGYRDPVLVSSTDSPGTKLVLATLMNRYDTVGVDAVNHCVNDVFTSGAKPLFFLDYLGVGRLDPVRAEALVKGVAEAVRESSAIKIHVCNLMTKPGESDGFRASDFLRLLSVYMGVDKPVDHLLANDGPIPENVRGRYAQNGQHPVEVDEEKCLTYAGEVVTASMTSAGQYLRHDPTALAEGIMGIVEAEERASLEKELTACILS